MGSQSKFTPTLWPKHPSREFQVAPTHFWKRTMTAAGSCWISPKSILKPSQTNKKALQRLPTKSRPIQIEMWAPGVRTPGEAERSLPWLQVSVQELSRGMGEDQHWYSGLSFQNLRNTQSFLPRAFQWHTREKPADMGRCVSFLHYRAKQERDEE